jgi:hypothetical protein
MRRSWYVLGGFVLGAAVTAAISHRSATDRATSSPSVTLAERELDRIVPSIHIENVPFDRAVQDVRKLTTVPIIVDDAELAAAQFDRKTPITMIGNNVPLGEILSRLASSDKHGHFIGYQVFGGGIVITSEAALGRNAIVRCYDVRELIGPQPRHNPDATFPHPPDQVREEDLVDLIEGVVAPESWRVNGGNIGAAYYFNGCLVVVQNWAGHREVRNVLAQLAAPEPLQSATGDQQWNELRKEWVLAGTTRAQDALLRKPILRIDLYHLSFDVAIESLQQLSGATIWIDRAELPKELIDQMPPVSLHLANAPLSQALGALTLLRAGDIQLGYTVKDGIVLITSRDKADRSAITRTYDIRDLISAPAVPGRHQGIEALVRLLEETVETDTWVDNGGLVGVTYELNGRLIIRQTWPAQEKVAMFLEALRSSRTRFDGPMNVDTRPKHAAPRK